MPDPAPTDDLLTLQEAADELKVHYMTAYRWVRKGDLPAFKAGGRLRVRRSELASYMQDRVVDTGGSTRSDSRRDWASHVEHLLEQLHDGRVTEANATVRKIISDGASGGEVYTQLLTPVLHEIGALWEDGRINVAIEHRATNIILGIMSRMSDHFRSRGPRRGIAATLSAPGDMHGVAAAMIADFLRSAGWEVHHLGIDVPLLDLRLFLDIVPADVVCVSVARPLPEETYRDIAEACEGREIIMGGAGAEPDVAARFGITVLGEPSALIGHLNARTADRVG